MADTATQMCNQIRFFRRDEPMPFDISSDFLAQAKNGEDLKNRIIALWLHGSPIPFRDNNMALKVLSNEIE